MGSTVKSCRQRLSAAKAIFSHTPKSDARTGIGETDRGRDADRKVILEGIRCTHVQNEMPVAVIFTGCPEGSTKR